MSSVPGYRERSTSVIMPCEKVQVQAEVVPSCDEYTCTRATPWPKPWEDLSFMVMEFPSVAARGRAMAKPNLQEANVVNNPHDAVFYYLEPNSQRAFRVELWHGQPIE